MPCAPPVTIATLPSSAPITQRRERGRDHDPVPLGVDQRLDLREERLPALVRRSRARRSSRSAKLSYAHMCVYVDSSPTSVVNAPTKLPRISCWSASPRLVQAHELRQLPGVARGSRAARRSRPVDAADRQYFSSSHSSIPYDEPSRPMPDSFMPPNGATSVETSPVLMPTIPYSSASGDAPDAPESRRVEVRREPVRRVVGDPHRLVLGREARDRRRPGRTSPRSSSPCRRDADEHRRLEELALDAARRRRGARRRARARRRRGARPSPSAGSSISGPTLDAVA